MPSRTPAGPRWRRGLCSLLSFFVFPWPQIIGRHSQPYCNDERLSHGWVIVLPGIDGRSHFNENLACGLNEAGLQAAIEIVDWTTGRVLAAAYHLRSRSLHEWAADKLARRIQEYHRRFPGRPVWIVAHSGGAGPALSAVAKLPEEHAVESITLLAPAVSRGYDLSEALARARKGIDNYYSPLDGFHLGVITLLLGTTDGRHDISAGVAGFRSLSSSESNGLRQHRASLTWVKHFHFGGHLGYCNRLFAAEVIAPRLSSAPGDVGTA